MTVILPNENSLPCKAEQTPPFLEDRPYDFHKPHREPPGRPCRVTENCRNGNSFNRQKSRDWSHPSIGPFPKSLWQIRLDRGDSRSQDSIQVTHPGGRRPSTWAIPGCLQGCAQAGTWNQTWSQPPVWDAGSAPVSYHYIQPFTLQCILNPLLHK